MRPTEMPGISAEYRALGALLEAHRLDRARGAVMKLEGEETGSVYFVISGWLAVSKSLHEGQRQIVDIVLPGEFLDPGSANARTSAVEIESLSQVAVAVLAREDWARLLQGYPELRRRFDRDTAAAVSRMSERMLRLGKGATESRIAYALCELCLRVSELGLVRDSAFHIPMTQQQLGDLAGLSAVHVCRTLRRFSRHGVIKVADHMDIRILDLDALAEIAEIDPAALQNEIITAA